MSVVTRELTIGEVGEVLVCKVCLVCAGSTADIFMTRAVDCPRNEMDVIEEVPTLGIECVLYSYHCSLFLVRSKSCWIVVFGFLSHSDLNVWRGHLGGRGAEEGRQGVVKVGKTLPFSVQPSSGQAGAGSSLTGPHRAPHDQNVL